MDDQTEHEAQAEQSEAEVVDMPPQMAYGVSIFILTDGSQKMHVHGEPDMGEIHRLLMGATFNVGCRNQALITIDEMDKAAKKKRIIT